MLCVASRSRRFPYGFPDCKQGPLADNLVCNSSASVVDRASALVNLFSVDELLNNTESTSDGVSRLGLPPYEWWSEALVSHFSLNEYLAESLSG